MKAPFTLSKEAVNVNVDRQFGADVLAAVTALRTHYRTTQTLDAKANKTLVDLFNSRGITIEVVWHTTRQNIMAIQLAPISGHSGSRQAGALGQTNVTSSMGLYEELTVDLDRMVVGGKFAREFPFVLHVSYAYLAGPFEDTTDREVTAMLLHEYAHAFDFFATMGDYVLLNYMLTEGTEVLMGQRPNVYKLEILDHTQIAKQIQDPTLRNEFIHNRTVENTRRAVLSSWRTLARPHLFGTTQNDLRRDEQLADVIPSRLGFGKDLVLALSRVDQAEVPGYFESVGNFWKMEVVRGLGYLLVAPFVLGLILFAPDLGQKYDHAKDRARRIRLDLVNQLRNVKDPSLKPAILEDIQQLTVIEDTYNKHAGVIDGLLYFFRPNYRQGKQNEATERTLEGLLNNDMFVQAYQLKQLAR
jgi:hypothetical protein